MWSKSATSASRSRFCTVARVCTHAHYWSARSAGSALRRSCMHTRPTECRFCTPCTHVATCCSGRSEYMPPSFHHVCMDVTRLTSRIPPPLPLAHLKITYSKKGLSSFISKQLSHCNGVVMVVWCGGGWVGVRNVVYRRLRSSPQLKRRRAMPGMDSAHGVQVILACFHIPSAERTPCFQALGSMLDGGRLTFV